MSFTKSEIIYILIFFLIIAVIITVDLNTAKNTSLNQNKNCYSKASGSSPRCWNEQDWKVYCEKTNVCKKNEYNY